MSSRAWAWLLALVALVVAGFPVAAMGGLFGLSPISIVAANSMWLVAIGLTIVSFIMSLRQAMRTRA